MDQFLMGDAAIGKDPVGCAGGDGIGDVGGGVKSVYACFVLFLSFFA